MKTNLASKLASVTVLTAGLVLGSAVQSSAGVMSILKGNKETSCACAGYQKVAFVGEATVREVKGDVQWLTGVEQWSPLPSNQSLKPGDVIKTGAAGKVVIKMASSGSFVSVTPLTILRLVPMVHGWSAATLTGEERNSGYVVRAVRGEAQFHNQDGWNKMAVNSTLAPGTKIRLVSGELIDLYSREQGAVRLSQRGEAVLPGVVVSSARELKASAPVMASAK